MLSKVLFVAAAAAGVQSSVIPRSSTCSFNITTGGATQYPVGQTDNGQTKASPNETASTFSLNGTALSDGQGRGCWFTPPTYVLQCDVNQVPATPFTIDCNGVISYNGSSTFYECPSGTGDIDNILLQPDTGETCEKISLVANGCHAQCSTTSSTMAATTSSCAAPSTHSVTITQSASTLPASTVTVVQTATPAAKTVTVTQPAQTVTVTQTATLPAQTQTQTQTQVQSVTKTQSQTAPAQTYTATATQTKSSPAQTTTATQQASTYPASTLTQSVTSKASSSSASPSASSTCPAELGSNYEYPHLIVPVDSSNKDTAEGTSYFGEVSSTISSLFNFDIPATDSGKTCTLKFLFPTQSQLETSSYTISGSGQVTFASLKTAATQSTTYNNQPAVDQTLGSWAVQPGNAYTITSFTCPSQATTVGYKLSTSGGSLDLKYFQDYNPCPIGLYITVS